MLARDRHFYRTDRIDSAKRSASVGAPTSGPTRTDQHYEMAAIASSQDDDV
jgi:hypothetical protein